MEIATLSNQIDSSLAKRIRELGVCSGRGCSGEVALALAHWIDKGRQEGSAPAADSALANGVGRIIFTAYVDKSLVRRIKLLAIQSDRRMYLEIEAAFRCWISAIESTAVEIEKAALPSHR